MKGEMYAGQSGITDAGWNVPGPSNASFDRAGMSQAAAAAAAAAAAGNTPNANTNTNTNGNPNVGSNAAQHQGYNAPGAGVKTNNGAYGNGNLSNAAGYMGSSPMQGSMMFTTGEYDDLRTKKLLDTFIHDFLIKSQLSETAQSFEREASLSDGEKKIDPSHDVPEGFLYEWWQIFWDVFNARTHRGGSEVAKKYFDLQLQRQRQEHTYRGVTMHVARVQQTAEQKGFYQHEMFDPMEFASIASTATYNQFNMSASAAHAAHAAQGSVPSSATSMNFPGYPPPFNSNGAPMSAGPGVPSQQQQHMQQQQQQPPQTHGQHPLGPPQTNRQPLSAQQQQQFQAFYNGVPGAPFYTPAMNPYLNQQQAQQAAYMGSNGVPNFMPLTNNNRPAGTGNGVANSQGSVNNVTNSNGNGNPNNSNIVNGSGSESVGNKEQMTPISTPSYAVNIGAPNQIPNSAPSQTPYSKTPSFSQQFGSIPTYINMNIPNSASAAPNQQSSQNSMPQNQSGPLQQGMQTAPSYSTHLSNNIGVNNMPMNSMNAVPGSNMNVMNQSANPSFEMSSMDSLYNYQKELLMLEKENKKVLSIAKETSLSSGSTPQTLTLSTSAGVGGKKNINAMLPPNSSQMASPQNQSPLTGGTSTTTATVPKKRKYTKRVKDFKKSQSEPNTPNTTALTPGAGPTKINMSSSLNPLYEHMSANNSPRDKILKSNPVGNSPFSMNAEATTENTKGASDHKRVRKSSTTKQSAAPSASTTIKPKKPAATKKTAANAKTPQNNIEEPESAGGSSKDPGSNNSLGLLPHNVLTDPTPHTDFDPMSIDPALSANSAFGFADDENSMIGTLENDSFVKKSDTFENTNDQKLVQEDKNSDKLKLDQTGFQLDFLDPNSSYNDFNFLNWQ